MNIRQRRGSVLIAVALTALVLAGCTEELTTQVVPVAKRLPASEEARYTLYNANHERVGAATMQIRPAGEDVELTLAYDFGADQQDTSTVVVAADSMKPRRSGRTVQDGDKRYGTAAEYSAEKVATVLNDASGKAQRREAKVSDSAYDNLESLFLWRTLDFSAFRQVRYTNVVVDPKRGTISRALGTVEVTGREELALPSGNRVQAWRVRFTSAGTTNTAWYRDDDTRALLRYEITRGPTLVLDGA